MLPKVSIIAKIILVKVSKQAKIILEKVSESCFYFHIVITDFYNIFAV